MKAIVSFILSAVMLNLSVHAGSSRKEKQEKSKDNDLIENPHAWEKQHMVEDKDMKKKKHRGFEHNPRPYSSKTKRHERIKTRE